MGLYYNKKRNGVGSQSEASQLVHDNEELIEIKGYQSYKIENKCRILTNNSKMNKQLNMLKTINYDGCVSVCDIGCSNGFFGIWYLFNTPIKHVSFMDHDVECSTNLGKLLQTIVLNNYEIINKNFIEGMQSNVKADVVLMLSLIHWLYSCTTQTGCLFEIIKMVRENTNKMLIIEWIDNEDHAIKSFKHTHFNKSNQKTMYNVENFEKALKLYFNKVEKIGCTNTQTRVLYVAYV